MADCRLPGLVAALILAQSGANAADWAHWLGPNRDGKVAEAVAEEPEVTVAWETTVGRGYSALAVAAGRAFTLGHDGKERETVYCLDATSGKEIWSHEYEGALIPRAHPGGPNAMPTIEGDRVYTISKDGQAFCFKVDDGELLWRRNLVEADKLPLPNWGFASGPMIIDKRVVFAGPCTFALSKATGEMLWQSKPVEVPGYATPLRYQADGDDLLLVLSGKEVAVHSSDDGRRIAGQPFSAEYDMTAATPVLVEPGVFFISGNSGGRLVRYRDKGLETAWETKEMNNEMATCVLVDGHLYGFSGKRGTRGATLTCLRATDGAVRWSEPGMGAGTLIAAGNRLLILSETGEVVIADASADGFKAVARKQILEKTCWTPPAFAGGKLYIRNDRGRVACVSLAVPAANSPGDGR